MFFWKEKYKFCIIPASITCLLSTIEILELSLKYVQSQQERQQNDIIDVVLELYLLTLNIFYTLFFCFHCWLWACNVCRNCENFLYCCHQIKLQQQIKLQIYSTKMIYSISLKMSVSTTKEKKYYVFQVIKDAGYVKKLYYITVLYYYGNRDWRCSRLNFLILTLLNFIS